MISGYEHNAVTRPLAALDAKVDVASGSLFHPEQVADAFDRLIVPGVDAVICNHVSNVFGFVQPVEAVAELCRTRGVPLIVDASQSAGILTLDLPALGAAFIAMPGHKGLYGPQGTGVLLCGSQASVRPLMEGGPAAFPSSRKCRISCRTVWRPGPTTCPVSQGCWKVCASSAGWVQIKSAITSACWPARQRWAFPRFQVSVSSPGRTCPIRQACCPLPQRGTT